MQVHRPTPLVVPVPTVLIVGLSDEVTPRLAASLGPSGITVRQTNLVELRNDSAQFRPIVLLVDAELYDFDPEAFDMVAMDVGAKLGVVGDLREAELTVKRMISALSLRGQSRTALATEGPSSQRAPLSQRSPPSREPPPQSGEEPTQKWRFSADELGLDQDPMGRLGS